MLASTAIPALAASTHSPLDGFFPQPGYFCLLYTSIELSYVAVIGILEFLKVAVLDNYGCLDVGVFLSLIHILCGR